MKNPHESSGKPFVIRRLDTVGYRLNRQIPATVYRTDCFLLLKEGEVLADAGEEPFLIESGHFLYIPAGIPFSIKYYNGSRGYMGSFSRSVLKSPNLGLLCCHVPVLVEIPEVERGFVAALAEKLFREQNGDTEAVSDILSGTLDLLLEQVGSLAGESSRRLQNPLCVRFLDMVFDRNSTMDGVSGYAGRLGVSASHLNRTVKGATGRSAGEWVDISRVALSKLLLRQSDMPIIDIALRSGFEDQSYFSRFFKRHTGLTPSEFRAGEE